MLLCIRQAPVTRWESRFTGMVELTFSVLSIRELSASFSFFKFSFSDWSFFLTVSNMLLLEINRSISFVYFTLCVGKGHG